MRAASTVFKGGDRVLLRTKELLHAADIGKLRPRWDGPFTVTACRSLNGYTLALPRTMRCGPTVNVVHLEPIFALTGTAPAPGPVSDAGQEGEREAVLRVLLLNWRVVRGVWRAGGATRPPTTSGLRLEELAHCPQTVADCAALRRRAARPAGPGPLRGCACSSRRAITVTCGARRRRISARGPFLRREWSGPPRLLFYWPPGGPDDWVREVVPRC